ncbi:MAG TPA: FAD/NAD(P)-binding oxidoreductase [Burkholderiales bacterium]|nr:FAD/NAD(P)-binding oxidoreductase [Burkholderiales bacterium]
MTFNRREFMKLAAASGALAGVSTMLGCATPGAVAGSKGRVVVVGGGFGGATAAKYIRMWEPGIDVVLVEPNDKFVSCPFSNRVLAGTMTIQELTVGYEKLPANRGVKLVRDTVTAVDAEKRQVRLAKGDPITYDRLILAPGIDFMYDAIPGMGSAEAQEKVLHAWKAGPQTVALRKQLESMKDGGVYALCIPKSPYRCPPGPYERASQVAYYLKKAKPKSKVLILDANDDIQSKKGLFTKAWNELYPGMVEYRANSELLEVDAKTGTAKLLGGDVKADVLNVIPPQRAGGVARGSGLKLVNERWADVEFLTYESKSHPRIHVIGDAIQPSPGMPKSGHMANQHGKIAADAVIGLMTARPVNDEPIIANTCYSWINDSEVVHVAGVYKYDKEKKTMVSVQGAGGLSPTWNKKEGVFALAWAENVWADTLT